MVLHDIFPDSPDQCAELSSTTGRFVFWICLSTALVFLFRSVMDLISWVMRKAMASLFVLREVLALQVDHI